MDLEIIVEDVVVDNVFIGSDFGIVDLLENDIGVVVGKDIWILLEGTVGFDFLEKIGDDNGIPFLLTSALFPFRFLQFLICFFLHFLDLELRMQSLSGFWVKGMTIGPEVEVNEGEGVGSLEVFTLGVGVGFTIIFLVILFEGGMVGDNVGLLVGPVLRQLG